jgi:hypothetical protein
MKRNSLEFAVRRTRQNGVEQVNIEMRYPDGTTETYHSLNQVPEQYRGWVEKFLQPLPDVPETLPLPDDSGSTFTSGKPPGKKKKIRPLNLTHYWCDVWAAAGALALAFFCYWNARHVFSGRDPWAWWVYLCILGMLGGVYLALVYLINRTTLVVDKKGLTVTHGPLPFRPSITIPRSELRQLFVRIESTRHITYSLCAKTNDGTHVLINGSNNPLELRRIEVLIEDRLGIVDEPVSGNQFR